MILNNSNYENNINFEKNNIHLWVIENKVAFFNFVKVLNSQINGEIGEFILSKNLNEMPISKNICMLLDFFNIDFNNKNILNGIIKKLEIELQENDYIIKLNELNAQILNFLYSIGLSINLDISYNDELEFVKLLKTYDIKITNQSSSLIETIINYIEVLIELNICKILVFVNLKQYLSYEEIIELYKYVNYKNFKIFLIENTNSKKIEDEKKIIIDNDLCEILVS